MINAGLAKFGPSTTRFISIWNWQGAPGDRCVPTTEGNCTIIDCRPLDGGTPAPGARAGAIELSSDAGSVSASPDAQGRYLTPTAPAWSAGDSVTVSAAGGPEIPAFSASVTIPPLLQITSPIAAPTVVRTQPFVASWTPTSDKVGLNFVQQSNTDPNDFVSSLCIFEGSAGTGTVPSSVLERALPSTGMTYLILGAAGTTELSPGGYEVMLNAPNGVGYSVIVQ